MINYYNKYGKFILLIISGLMYLIAYFMFLFYGEEPSNMYVLTTLFLTIQAYHKD